MAAYDVVAVDGGLDITFTPKGIAEQLGMSARTDRYLPLAGESFIAVELDEGVHPVVTFVDNGRYLFNGRAARRDG
jgi:hypothetical protein